MSIKVKIYNEISNRGGYTDNAEFYILKCKNCGSYALYDEEHSFIYLNPEDLTQRTLYGLNISESVNCLVCGTCNSFDDTPERDEDKVIKSPWGFVIVKKT
jgi:hypothetical protein